MDDTQRLDWMLGILFPDSQHTDESMNKFAALKRAHSEGKTGREAIDAAMQQ